MRNSATHWLCAILQRTYYALPCRAGRQRGPPHGQCVGEGRDGRSSSLVGLLIVLTAVTWCMWVECCDVSAVWQKPSVKTVKFRTWNNWWKKCKWKTCEDHRSRILFKMQVCVVKKRDATLSTCKMEMLNILVRWSCGLTSNRC